MNAAKVLEDLKRRFPNEPEYHQAVEEVLGTRNYRRGIQQTPRIRQSKLD